MRACPGKPARRRRVRHGSGRPTCDSGSVASLLDRLPRRAPGAGPSPGVLLVPAVTAAVTVAGLAAVTVALIVVQTLDPSGGLPVGGSAALAGRLWLLAQGGELR